MEGCRGGCDHRHCLRQRRRLHTPGCSRWANLSLCTLLLSGILLLVHQYHLFPQVSVRFGSFMGAACARLSLSSALIEGWQHEVKDNFHSDPSSCWSCQEDCSCTGQRVGTMFDKAAAAEALVEHDNRLKRAQSQSRSGSLPLSASHPAQGARSSAQAARNAARALQSLDSEVRGTLDLWQRDG